jgi:hypothetical protein
MAVISPSVPFMSLFGIQRSSSLFWLRRRTSCSASVPVKPLAVVAGQAQDLEYSGQAIVPKPAALATRLGISAEQLLAAC